VLRGPLYGPFWCFEILRCANESSVEVSKALVADVLWGFFEKKIAKNSKKELTRPNGFDNLEKFAQNVVSFGATR
jgi:hypothetical protein